MKRSSIFQQCDLFRILLYSGILGILCLCSFQPSYGQDVQWATKLLGFSSELRLSTRGYDYRAKQILGAPNKLPDIGNSPCAWSPAKMNGNSDEWIKVAFQKPTLLRQVAIAENLNQGGISQVFAYTTEGKEILIFKNSEPPSGPTGKMLRIFPENPIANVDAIKIVIDPSRTPGYNQIDAIGISSSATPIQATINVSASSNKALVKENLGKNVNSKGQEVAPVISPDGKTLYFTRSKHPGNTGVPEKQDIWLSTLDINNKWSAAINIGSPINNAGDNAMAAIAPDGKTVYLINVYLPNGQMANGLSKSTRTGEGWSFPKECKILNHYNLHRANYTEFAISPQENVMILSVERNDTEGNKDLYVSFLKPGSEIWSEPVNMGPVLNTADYEGAPFIASDNKSLYFTSQGHSGYGNGDIFISRRLDDTWTKWSTPENLGQFINTNQWDGYFNIPASGDYAYMSSQEKGAQEDIFRIQLFPSIKPEPVAMISGFVYDGQSNTMITADIQTDVKASNKPFQKAAFDPKTGEYKLILPLKEKYRITAEHEGYFPSTEEIDLSTENSYRAIRKNIYLSPIKAGQKIVLNQIGFTQSQAQFDTTSFPEMNRVVQLMHRYPTLEILLEGHTDNQGDTQKNIKLSEDRVLEVKKYLSSHGISEGRIQTKAWGPTRPIANNLTEQSRQKNRRVEFTILKI